jgi:hypothetical protein
MKKPTLPADLLGTLVPDALDLADSFRAAFAHTPLAGAVLGCGRAWRAAVRRCLAAEAEVERLKVMVESLAARCVGQSELLSKKAEVGRDD